MQKQTISRVATALTAAVSISMSTPLLAQSGNHFEDTKRIIVKFKQTQDDAPEAAMRQEWMEEVFTTLGVSVSHLRETSFESSVFEIDDSYGVDFTQILVSMAGMGDVLHVEEDVLMQHTLKPNDTDYSKQWHYFEQNTSINAEPAWDKATGKGVVVAVLDTGYRPHADLNANILPGYDMISDKTIGNDGDGRDSDARDPGDATVKGECGNGQPLKDTDSSWHGTHVAGTISAVTNNSLGVAGVAHGAKIVPVRVLGKCGGYLSDIADGIVWASGGSVSGVPANNNPAKVINMSLGGGGFFCSSTYSSAIDTARANGATVVVSAGNSAQDADSFQPANCEGVITVAATGPTGKAAFYTNFGEVVDVAAPGGDLKVSSTGGVLSTANSGTKGPASDTYEYYQGTSMAAPHVAGIAALLYEVKPSITPDQVESAIVDSARAFPGTCNECGSGIADAKAAIDALGNGGGNDDGGNDDGGNDDDFFDDGF